MNDIYILCMGGGGGCKFHVAGRYPYNKDFTEILSNSKGKNEYGN